MSLSAVKLGYQTTMFTMTLKEIKDAIGATFVGSDVDLSRVIRGINTDSRTIKQDELFVALKGDNFDGHDFITYASDRGASAYLIDHVMDEVKPAVVVNDTKIAFGQLASAWRDNFSFPIVAVTGSNGKTTVKEMINSILSTQGHVLATKGNFNNDIGVPITLYRLKSGHDSAVIEMGANHGGEISYLTQLVKPDIAIITNAASAHLEGFGSLDGVAKAKGEIFEGLSENGVAVINADDKYFGYWKELNTNRKIVTFGLSDTADVSCEIKNNNLLNIRIKNKTSFEVQLPLLGKHNVVNALTATAAAIALNVNTSSIKKGLEGIQAVPGRLVTNMGVNKSIVIDDTYNANPSSLAAAIDVLSTRSGTHHVVLGDMGELGEDSVNLHKDSAQMIKQGNVKYLYTIGKYSQYASESFGDGAQHFSSQQDLVEKLKNNIKPSDTVLVKGSRSMHMENIVKSICNAEANQGNG